jgi:hypothetical protein
MRAALLAVLLVATTATTASAQITFTSNAGGTASSASDPGYGSQQLIVDFNGGPYTGVAFGGSYSIQTGLFGGLAAPPAGVTNGYFATPNKNLASASGTATINFSGFLASRSITGLSFYWGSIDDYNSLRFLTAGGSALSITLGTGTVTSLTGANITATANGNQQQQRTNRRVYFDLSNVQGFTTLQLTSTRRAFEIDNIAVTVVPEPGSFALVSVGLVALARVARRRRA